MPAVLNRNPYSDTAWKGVLPFLINKANETHKPQLLEFLKLDPRAADVFLAKGWFDDALPLIKNHLIEGRLPSPKVFLELAKLNDPALAESLQREFPRVTGHIEEIGILL